MLGCAGLDGYVDGCVSARMDSMVVDCVDVMCVRGRGLGGGDVVLWTLPSGLIRGMDA